MPDTSGHKQATAEQTDYKAKLDKAADEAREKSRKSSQPGIVSSIVDQVSHILPASGKKILGIGDGDGDKTADAGNDANANDNDTRDIPGAVVQDFIRDAHRSKVANFAND